MQDIHARRTGMAALAGFTRLARDIAERVRLWQEARHLMAMDSSMLKDIGVPRGGIEGMVRHGRDRDFAVVAQEQAQPYADEVGTRTRPIAKPGRHAPVTVAGWHLAPGE